MAVIGIAEPAVSLGEAQAFVRVETGEEEAVLAGLLRTASAVCEAFLNQVVIARSFSEVIPASPAWQRLQSTPVRSIDAVEAIADDQNVISTNITRACLTEAQLVDAFEQQLQSIPILRRNLRTHNVFPQFQF